MLARRLFAAASGNLATSAYGEEAAGAVVALPLPREVKENVLVGLWTWCTAALFVISRAASGGKSSKISDISDSNLRADSPMTCVLEDFE
eukprot:COSAG05_NODE_4670_length_1416_cov_8.111551_1_plen_89_part_10